MARDGGGAPVDLCFTYKGWLRLNADMMKQEKNINLLEFQGFLL